MNTSLNPESSVHLEEFREATGTVKLKGKAKEPGTRGRQSAVNAFVCKESCEKAIAFIFIEVGYKQGCGARVRRGHLKLVSARKRIGRARGYRSPPPPPPRGDRTRHAAARRRRSESHPFTQYLIMDIPLQFPII